MNQLNDMMPEDARKLVSTKISELRRGIGIKKKVTLTDISKIVSASLKNSGKNRDVDIGTVWALERGEKDQYTVEDILDVGSSLGVFGGPSALEKEQRGKYIECDNEESIGSRIKRRREELGLTRPEVCDLTKGKIKASFLFCVETKKKSKPSGEKLIEISRVLKVTPEWLLTGKANIDDSESKSIANIVSSLSPRDRKIVMAIIDAMSRERENNE